MTTFFTGWRWQIHGCAWFILKMKLCYIKMWPLFTSNNVIWWLWSFLWPPQLCQSSPHGTESDHEPARLFLGRVRRFGSRERAIRQNYLKGQWGKCLWYNVNRCFLHVNSLFMLNNWKNMGKLWKKSERANGDFLPPKRGSFLCSLDLSGLNDSGL